MRDVADERRLYRKRDGAATARACACRSILLQVHEAERAARARACLHSEGCEMIYRRDEFVQDDTGDEDFPIMQVDRLMNLDESEQRFIGRATLSMQTPVGVQQIPLSFEIDATSIEQAFELYAQTARPKIEELRLRLQERLEELRRQEQSRIITPDAGGIPGGVIRLDDLRRKD
jgi:hypothetical protein